MDIQKLFITLGISQVISFKDIGCVRHAPRHRLLLQNHGFGTDVFYPWCYLVEFIPSIITSKILKLYFKLNIILSFKV